MDIKYRHWAELACLFLFFSLNTYAQDFNPSKGAYPTPMCDAQYQQNCYFFQTQKAGFDSVGKANSGYEKDGRLKGCAVETLTSSVLKGLLGPDADYLFAKLPDNCNTGKSYVTYQGTKYTVYSAIPKSSEISQAYQDASKYYEPAEFAFPLAKGYGLSTLTPIVYLDPTTPLEQKQTIPTMINKGSPTKLLSEGPQASLANPSRNVLVYQNTSDVDQLFIPNIPGYMDNVLWSIDAYKGSTAGFPNDGNQKTFHMLGYGWMLDPKNVAKQFFVQQLENDGGTAKNSVTLYLSSQKNCQYEVDKPFNYLRVLLKGKEYLNKYGFDASNCPKNTPDVKWKRSDLITALQALANNPDYPFPRLTWLNEGAYLPVRPKPGFQRNLIRWYTPWGAWNILNNTSGLFLRKDGSVEIPLDGEDPIPPVVQTWDGSQRFTLINLTDDVVSSVTTDYPGAENYFQGNAFFPANRLKQGDNLGAGVLTATVNYSIWDNTKTLRPRQTDGWLGLIGQAPEKAMQWGDAPIISGDTYTPTEPGGQSNKPYMWGADASPVIEGKCDESNPCKYNGPFKYSFRLQHANSFMVARDEGTQIDKEVYQAEYLIAPDGKNYSGPLVTLYYDYKPWQMSSGSNVLWQNSQDKRNAMVPQAKVDWDGIKALLANNKDIDMQVKISTATNFSAARTVSWKEENYDPVKMAPATNQIDGPVRFFTVAGSSMNPDTKFLIVLKPLGASDLNIQLMRPLLVETNSATFQWKTRDDGDSGNTVTSNITLKPSGTGGEGGGEKNCVPPTDESSGYQECTVTFNNLSKDTRYSYTIEASNGSANATLSGFITTQGGTPPPPVDKIKVTFKIPDSSMTVTLNGNPVVDGAEKTIGGDSNVVNATLAGSSTGCTIQVANGEMSTVTGSGQLCTKLTLDNTAKQITLPSDSPPPPVDKKVSLTLNIPTVISVTVNGKAYSQNATVEITSGTSITAAQNNNKVTGTLTFGSDKKIACSGASFCQMPGIVIDSNSNTITFPANIPAGTGGNGGLSVTIGLPANTDLRTEIDGTTITTGNAVGFGIKDGSVIKIYRASGDIALTCPISLKNGVMSAGSQAGCIGIDIESSIKYIGIPASVPN